MGKLKHTIIFSMVVLLFACGQQDVHSACFENADHVNMSDAKIRRICDCIEKGVSKQKANENETRWIVAWLNDDPIEGVPIERDEILRISSFMSGLKRNCEKLR